MEWQIPPGNLAPGRDRMDLWRCCLDLDSDRVDKYAALLSGDEKQRAERYAIETKRNQFIVGRGFLRRTLGLMLDTNPRGFVFHYGPKGKPSLPSEPLLRFNLSHAGRWAILAVGLGREVGIDIEQIRPRPHLLAMAERFFAREEIQSIVSTESSDLTRTFYTCWCRKEAILKAAGEGIWMGLDTFAVTARPDQPPELIRLNWPGQEDRTWSLADIPIDHEHAAALAHEGAAVPIHCWDPSALPTAPADARGVPRVGIA